MPVTPPSESRTDIAGDPNNRQQSRRISKIREYNLLEDERLDRMIVLHDGALEADLEDEGSMDWGDPISVGGYDRIFLFLDYEHGSSDHTEVTVKIQAGPVRAANSPLWFDVYNSADNSGDLAPFSFSVPTDGDDFKRMWNDCRRQGYYMRFKVFADGSTVTDSRALLRGIRDMDGH